MNPCTKEIFELQKQALRKDRTLSGPIIHSAPAGNIFRGQFEERAWLVGSEPVLVKRRFDNGDWEYFADVECEGRPS